MCYSRTRIINQQYYLPLDKLLYNYSHQRCTLIKIKNVVQKAFVKTVVLNWFLQDRFNQRPIQNVGPLKYCLCLCTMYTETVWRHQHNTTHRGWWWRHVTVSQNFTPSSVIKVLKLFLELKTHVREVYCAKHQWSNSEMSPKQHFAGCILMHAALLVSRSKWVWEKGALNRQFLKWILAREYSLRRLYPRVEQFWFRFCGSSNHGYRWCSKV